MELQGEAEIRQEMQRQSEDTPRNAKAKRRYAKKCKGKAEIRQEMQRQGDDGHGCGKAR